MDFERLQANRVMQPASDGIFTFETLGAAPVSAHQSGSKLAALYGPLLIILVLMAAVPAGGDRPLLWVLMTLSLAMLGLIYGLAHMIWNRGAADPVSEHLTLILPAVAAMGCAMLQLLPMRFDPTGALPPDLWPDVLTINRSATILALVRMAGYLLMFWLLISVGDSAARVSKMATLLFWGLFAHAVWGLLALSFLGDIYLWGDKLDYAGSATGTFINRNSYATFLGMGVSLGIALTVKRAFAPSIRMPSGPNAWSPHKFDVVLLGTATFVILVTVLATQSRLGSFATVLGAVVTLVLMMAKAELLTLALIWRGVAVGGGALMAVLLVMGQGLLDRSLLSVAGSIDRLALYREVIGMIADRPLMGFGLDGFPDAFELYHDAALDPSLVWDRTHNTYLALWVELGLIAGSLPMIAVAIAGVKAGRNLVRRSDGYATSAATIGAIVTVAVHALGDFSLEVAGNTYLFIALIALGVARFRRAGVR